MGIIHVKGIRCYAYHGCLKEETKIGGEYIVDVWIKADLAKAAATDKLENTIDYCDVQSLVLKEMKKPGRLIEHVCGRILNALKKNLPAIILVRVRVTKINPPLNGDVKQVSVSLQG